ncbi:MAG: hypothetical protein ACKKMW_01910 [Candidatus Nealsonbacteria bacterium]
MANILIGIIVAIVLFLIFRAYVLWYWKVDEIIKLLKEISNNLKGESKEKKE